MSFQATKLSLLSSRNRNLTSLALLAALIGCGCRPTDSAEATQAPAAAVAGAQVPASPAQTPPQTSSEALPAEACKAGDGWPFFEAFVTKPGVRARYSAPKVEVRDIEDPERLITTEDAAQVEPFKIGQRDFQWVYADPSAKDGGGDRVKLDDKMAGNTFRIDFVRAEFTPDGDLIRTSGKPGAYVFEHVQDCWRLVQELR